MKKTIVFLVFGIVLFGVCFTQNANAQKVDTNLNGTWVYNVEGMKTDYKFNNGNYEHSVNGYRSKGTYTTENGKITLKTTDAHGDGFNEFMHSIGVDFDWGLQSKWYTNNEFFLAVKPSLLKLGISEKQANEFIVELSKNTSMNYSVDNKTLILIADDGIPVVFSKK